MRRKKSQAKYKARQKRKTAVAKAAGLAAAPAAKAPPKKAPLKKKAAEVE
jgi:hypothetical protein